MGTAVIDPPVADPATPPASDPTPPTPTPTDPPAPANTLVGDPAKPDNQKPATDPPKPAEVAYTLKLPENSVLPESAIERTTAIARESGLSNESAQKLLESLNTEVASDRAAYFESIKPGGAQWTAQVNEWEGAALKDPQIGGSPEKLKASVDLAKGVLKDFADPEVSAFLHDTGFGSHPMVIRMLAKVAKATSEGTVLPRGSQNTQSESDEDARLRRKYPHPSNDKNNSQETTT